MKKETRLYNVIIPVWMLFIFPLAWIGVIFGNFIIDGLVLIIILSAMKIPQKIQIWKKSILKIYLFGLLSDAIGTALMFFVTMTPAFESDITQDIMLNPFGNIFSLLIVLVIMAISSVCIYLFDSRFSFRKTDLETAQQRKISLLFAIITCPWLFLLPTEWFYGY